MKNNTYISNEFLTLINEATEFSKVWLGTLEQLEKVNKLDERTFLLIYIALLSVKGLKNGISIYVKRAKKIGISKEEIISAILISLPLEVIK